MEDVSDASASRTRAGAGGGNTRRAPRGRDPNEYRAPAFSGEGEGWAPLAAPAERADRPARTSDKRLFDAVCATCKAKTQVPFEPTAGRDVFCRDCFRARKR